MSDIVEQYKIFVQAMIQVSKDRYTQNQFLMGINTIFLAGIGYIIKEQMNLCLILPIAFFGAVLCYIWILLIEKYREYIEHKILVIKDAEENKSELYGFYTEEIKKHGPNFKSISMIEENIPKLFIFFYIGIITIVIVKLCH